MSLSDEEEKNIEQQQKLLKAYFTKALDTTNDLQSVIQNMMFVMFHQQQMMLILFAAMDDKLDRLESIEKQLVDFREDRSFM